MSLCVEDILVQRDQGRVREQEEEVLERLPQEEALHLVPLARLQAQDVVYGAITPRHLGVGLEGLEDLPAPPPVLLVLCDPVEHKEAETGRGENRGLEPGRDKAENADRLSPLYSFRTEEVVGVGLVNKDVFRPVGVGVEIDNLRGQFRRHLLVHLVASVGQLFGGLRCDQEMLGNIFQ